VNYHEPDLPAPSATDLAPPTSLKGVGRQEWMRLAQSLSVAGVLTAADRSAFLDYCLALSDLRRYEAKARRAGLELSIAKGYANQIVKLRTQVTALRSHLGLTPSSRAAVKAKRAQTPQDTDRERFFGSGQRGA
jgi:P27 family predicted phage terminase small subunit